MALFAVSWPLVHSLVTGNAECVSGIFAPIGDFAGLVDMAWRTFVIQTFLVIPVFEREHQVSHFKFDGFRPGPHRRFRTS
jgi:hypothetical protein